MISRKSLSRFNHADEVDSEGSWAISYGDMVTLLLTFFIVFFSVNPDNSLKNVKLNIALVDTLSKKSEATQPDQGASNQISVGQKKEKGVDPIILKEWNGLVHDQGSHVIIEFPGVSFFKTSSTDVTTEGKKALQKFIKVYEPYAAHYKVSIRSFADQRKVVPRDGLRFKDNLELTALRSVSTMRVLQKLGLPLSQIKLGGYGEHVVTARELGAVPAEARKLASDLDLARKVVLVIEPEAANETNH